jgi:hypothetical protein
VKRISFFALTIRRVACSLTALGSLTAVQVARVKNKWKCVLKDGMIHINGKDYLFAKCTGYVPPHPLSSSMDCTIALGNSNGSIQHKTSRHF